MANEFTSGIGADLFTNILQEALFTATEQSVARGVARNYTLASGAGKTFQVPVYSSATAAAVAEGTDLANVAITNTAVDIALAEIGVMTTVTDLMLESSPLNVAADLGNILGRALAEQFDRGLTGLFTGFTETVGAVDAALTVASLFKAAAHLRSVNAPGPYYAILHPACAYSIKAELASNGGSNIPNLSDMGNMAMQTGVIGSVAGITIIEHSLVAASTTGFVNAVFSRDAVGIAVGREPRLEQERDASYRRSELVMSMTAGQAVLKANYGVELLGLNGLA